MGRLAQAAAVLASSAAAYVLVDLSDLDSEDRKAIEEDALAGGKIFGIRVVEEAVNGGARAPLYGYYKDGGDAERWAAAKKEYGIDASDVDDASILAGSSGFAQDPRREAALREAAAQRALAEADALREAEEAEVRTVTGENGEAAQPPVGARAAAEPTANIADATLARNATNEAADAGPAEDNDEEGNKPDEESSRGSRSSRRSRNPR